MEISKTDAQEKLQPSIPRGDTNEPHEEGIDDRMSDVEDVKEEDIDPDVKKNCKQRWCTPGLIVWYVIGLLFVGLIIAIFALWNVYFGRIVTSVFDFIQHFARENSAESWAFFIGAQFCFEWFLIPGVSYFNIAQAFFMQEYLKPFLISAISASIAGCSVFLLSRYCFASWLRKKLDGFLLFHTLLVETSREDDTDELGGDDPLHSSSL